MPKSAASPSEIALIDGREDIGEVLVDMIGDAERYLFAVGGRSRDPRVLTALEQRVLRGDIQYVRLITGNHIRHQLCHHLRLLMRDAAETIKLGYLREEHYGSFLVTHDAAVVALPGSKVSFLDLGLRIAGTTIAAALRDRTLQHLGNSDQLITAERVRQMCKTCRGIGSQA